jgi:hypothetical protein
MQAEMVDLRSRVRLAALPDEKHQSVTDALFHHSVAG